MNNYEDKTDDRIVIPAEHISDQYDLRDYFAAKAMHEILVRGGWSEYDNLAKEAYAVGDAMLKERDKEE